MRRARALNAPGNPIPPRVAGARALTEGHLLALFVTCFLTLAGGPAAASDCVRYEPDDVSLAGTLRLQVYPGPPHYKSFDTGDQPESVWMLELSRPLCIDATPGDAANVAVERIERVQMVPRAPFSVSYNGKVAHVQGTLFHAHGGHSHADILMRATSVTPESR
jgi:hypothetical protein